MELEYIPKNKLRNGVYYKGYSRNVTIARWDSSIEMFIYERSKFGTKVTEKLNCPEDEDKYDVFFAIEPL